MLDKLASTARKTGRVYGIGTFVAFPVLLAIIIVRGRKTHAENDFGFNAGVALAFSPAWPWALGSEILDWRDRRRHR